MPDNTDPSIFNPRQAQILQQKRSKINFKHPLILTLLITLLCLFGLIIIINVIVPIVSPPVEDDPITVTPTEEIDIVSVTPTEEIDDFWNDDSEVEDYLPPIRILGNEYDNSDYIDLDGYAPFCQPENFDPEIQKFAKIDKDGNPSDYYSIEGYDRFYEVMTIIGEDESDDKRDITLPYPFEVTIYEFGCASSTEYVLDITKNGLRQSLFNNVNGYVFTDDGKYLYITYSKYEEGGWILHKEIIDIVGNKMVDLPSLSCVYDSFFQWDGNRLLTLNKEKNDLTTRVCMWDTSGNLITRINAYIQWYWFLEEMPIEKIGLLPKDPDVFYAYTSLPGWGCNVFLVDINSGEYNRIEVTDTVGYKHNCAIPLLTELDLSEVTLKAGILKYRIEADTDVWGDWKEVPVEEPRVPNTVILN